MMMIWQSVLKTVVLNHQQIIDITRLATSASRLTINNRALKIVSQELKPLMAHTDRTNKDLAAMTTKSLSVIACKNKNALPKTNTANINLP